MVSERRKVGAPVGNQNRRGKGLKAHGRIPLNLSISDQVEVSPGTLVDLRSRFEAYLLACGEEPTEDAIKALARRTAYRAWWELLRRDEDEQAVML